MFAVLIELIRALDTAGPPTDSVEAAQAVWSALHGAVAIEIARIGQASDASVSFEHMLDLLIVALTARVG